MSVAVGLLTCDPHAASPAALRGRIITLASPELHSGAAGERAGAPRSPLAPASFHVTARHRLTAHHPGFTRTEQWIQMKMNTFMYE